MINLYKASVVRLFKNIFFLGGLVIALVVSYLFASKTVSMIFLDDKTATDTAKFVSVAMVLFFSMFVPVYLGSEYADGGFRNKVITGYTQTQVYIANFLALLTGSFVMTLVWLVSSVIGGMKLSLDVMGFTLMTVIYLGGLISVLVFVGMRSKKASTAAAIAIGLLFLSYNAIIFGNVILSFSKEGFALEVKKLLYCVTAFGQWFSSTCFYAPELDPGYLAKFIISLALTGVMLFVGTRGINKRDIN